MNAHQNFIGGTWTASSVTLDVLNPADGSLIGRIARGGAAEIDRAVEAAVFINNYGAGGGVELPFGGVRGSGHGREKGLEALYSFSAVKTIAIKHGI